MKNGRAEKAQESVMWQVRKLDCMGERQAWALAKIHGSACLHVRLRGWIAGQASSLSP